MASIASDVERQGAFRLNGTQGLIFGKGKEELPPISNIPKPSKPSPSAPVDSSLSAAGSGSSSSSTTTSNITNTTTPLKPATQPYFASPPSAQRRAGRLSAHSLMGWATTTTLPQLQPKAAGSDQGTGPSKGSMLTLFMFGVLIAAGAPLLLGCAYFSLSSSGWKYNGRHPNTYERMYMAVWRTLPSTLRSETKSSARPAPSPPPAELTPAPEHSGKTNEWGPWSPDNRRGALTGLGNGAAAAAAAPAAVKAAGLKGERGGHQHHHHDPENCPVTGWLRQHSLSQYAEAFIENGYDDLHTVMEIGDSDLDHIGVVKPGHRKKFTRLIALLRSTTPPSPPPH